VTGRAGRFVPPTDKMRRFLASRVDERALAGLSPEDGALAADVDGAVADQRLDRWRAMSLIDALKAQPLRAAVLEADPSVVGPGVYLRNGELFVVKLNRQRTRVFARRVVEITGSARRVNEDGDRVRVDLVYAPGVVQRLRPADRLSLEAARPFLVRYSNCMVCGTALRDAVSVLDSIGPVCRRMFEPAPAPAPAPEPDVVAALFASLR
jgi:hypothetical protein